MKKTIENLAKAFVGESQARNRYSRYAKIAKAEGYEEIAANFALTADQEAEHAKWLMRMINTLKDGDEMYDEIGIDAKVPTILEKTKKNLKAAIGGENYEYTDMYPDFAEVAREEGLDEVADRLLAIAEAEKNHEDRFKKFLDELERDVVFEKEIEVVWQCRKCGFMKKNKNAPKECSSCSHPQAYFEVK